MARGLVATRLRSCAMALLACVLGLGCELDNRDVQGANPGRPSTDVGNLEPLSGSGGGATGGGKSGVDPNLPLAGGQQVASGALGAGCQQSSDCTTGNCVDGVCCDSACTELCAACNLPGNLGSCTGA